MTHDRHRRGGPLVVETRARPSARESPYGVSNSGRVARNPYGRHTGDVCTNGYTMERRVTSGRKCACVMGSETKFGKLVSGELDLTPTPLRVPRGQPVGCGVRCEPPSSYYTYRAIYFVALLAILLRTGSPLVA